LFSPDIDIGVGKLVHDFVRRPMLCVI